jgi:DNA-binding transcriptional regulator/RsmH inhibitor MraZ
MADLLEAFDSVMAEGGDTEQPETISRNANVYTGDDSETEVVETEVEVSESSDSDVDSETDAEDIDVEDVDVTEEGFDFDSIKDKTVSVTVNGETFDVPLHELRNGYMRQADYTRKTQSLSEVASLARWANEMQEALQTNPVGTLKYLQEALGVSLSGEPEDPWADLDPEIKPIVSELQATRQELQELRARSEQAEQVRFQEQARFELDQMMAKYPDFDPQVVLPIAIQEGLGMEKAYRLWKAEQIERESAAQKAAREKAEAAAVKRDKARKASQKVSKGGSNVAASSDDSWKKFDSFEDIFAYEVEKTRT